MNKPHNFILATGDKNALKLGVDEHRYVIMKHPSESDSDYIKRVKERVKQEGQTT